MIYTVSQDLTLGTIQAMRMQEDKAYCAAALHSQLDDDAAHPIHEDYSEDDIANFLQWRREMAKWCLDVAEVRGIPIETVEIALSILDRFFPHDEEVMRDCELFQLACMASLYIASKLNEKNGLTLKQMEEFSCREFSRQEFEYMEIHILYSLQWRVNPPTVVSFARNLLDLMPEASIPDRSIILKTVEAQVETLLVDERFLPIKASTIALAALVNALHPLINDEDLANLFHQLRYALDYQESFNIEQNELQKALHVLSSGSLDAEDFAETSSSSSTRSTSLTPSEKDLLYPSSPRSVVS